MTIINFDLRNELIVSISQTSVIQEQSQDDVIRRRTGSVCILHVQGCIPLNVFNLTLSQLTQILFFKSFNNITQTHEFVDYSSTQVLINNEKQNVLHKISFPLLKESKKN